MTTSTTTKNEEVVDGMPVMMRLQQHHTPRRSYLNTSVSSLDIIGCVVCDDATFEVPDASASLRPLSGLLLLCCTNYS